jgi:hypothetical protein
MIHLISIGRHLARLLPYMPFTVLLQKAWSGCSFSQIKIKHIPLLQTECANETEAAYNRFYHHIYQSFHQSTSAPGRRRGGLKIVGK